MPGQPSSPAWAHSAAEKRSGRASARRASLVGYARSNSWRADSASRRWSSSRVRSIRTVDSVPASRPSGHASTASSSLAPGEAEAPLGDDVLLHLGGAGSDGDRDALDPLARHLAGEEAPR